MNKNILVIVAHPDDEAIGCGGTLAKHKADNDTIHIIYMTDGVSARENSEDIDANERNKMAHAAGKYLSAKQYFFNFPDNSMDKVPLIDIVQAIESVLSQLSPDIIYTHHYGDLNIDHQIVHQAVMTANRPQPNRHIASIYTFEVNSSTEWGIQSSTNYFLPSCFIDITKHVVDKNNLLDIYAKEMRPYPHSRSKEAITALTAVRGSSVGVNYAEAFMLIRELK
jgi:LmbE family N-acetylglucosaminyl deacetylase